MKKASFTLIFCMCCAGIFAQQHINKKQLEVLNKGAAESKLLADDDNDFTHNAAAGKWEDESAIILSQKTSFDFDRKGVSAGKRIGRNIWGAVFALPTLGMSLLLANSDNSMKMLIEERERRKILLKDKFAIEQYSVLYFRLSAEGDGFAARVIKANGNTQKIDMAEAVTVDNINAVPNLFRSYTDQRFSSSYRPDYYKLAVPDLEEGDILEYEYVNMNQKSFSHNPGYIEFDPIYYLCNRRLPVVHQAIEVVSEDNRYHVGYKSMQGSPDFTLTTARGKHIYRWEDNNRDKITDTRYLNEFLELPSVKFQMVYALNNSETLVWFKNEDDMKKDVTPADLGDKIKAFWFNSSKLLDASNYAPPSGNALATEKTLFKLLKKRGITDLTDNDYVNKTYYTIRAQTMYRNWSDYAFAKVFSALLNEKKIPNEIVVTASNERTNLNKIAFAQELTWMVKYHGIYYCNPDEHLNPGEMPATISGNTAVIFNGSSFAAPVANEVIPAGDTLDNKYSEQISATLDMGKGSMAVVKNVEANGLIKQEVIDEALALTPYMQNDYTNYDGTDMWEGLDAKAQDKAFTDFNDQKKEWKEQKPLMMKAIAESQYSHRIEAYTDFRLLQDGRSLKKKVLKYQETFTIGDMSAPAGDDIVVALSSLTGNQPKIKKEERTRVYPVNVSYPRELLWTISMPVPAGYTVKGLDGLTKTVSNECGSFMSVALLKDNFIVISVKKVYKQQNFDVSKWPLMLDILDAGYKFSQSKIILKKG